MTSMGFCMFYRGFYAGLNYKGILYRNFVGILMRVPASVALAYLGGVLMEQFWSNVLASLIAGIILALVTYRGGK